MTDGIQSALPSTHRGNGLTKREYFAAMAIKGILSNPHLVAEYENSTELIADAATLQADRLIESLNKEKEG